MNNAVILQQCWDGVFYPGDYRPCIELTRERNQAYCDRHGFDLEIVIGTLSEQYSNVNMGAWVKVEMIDKALKTGYEYVVWLDADALIKDMDTDLRDACPNGIGACWMRIPQLHHWNTGVLYVRNSPEVRAFFSEWLSNFPGDKQWREQGIFNKLAMQSKVVQTISDKWNATINYSMVPDAVVLGYHGNGDAAYRYRMMKETLEQLSPPESEKTLVMSEAANG